MKLADIAIVLGAAVEGNDQVEISGLAGLEDAKEGELSFLANARYYNLAKCTRASAIIVGLKEKGLGQSLLRHENPYLTFAKAIELFYQPVARPARIHPTAAIAETANLGKRVSIGAFAVIGEHVELGVGRFDWGSLCHRG